MDAATGRVQGTTPVNGAEDLALGGGHLWAVSVRRAGTGLRYALLEIDPRTMRIVKQAPLDGPVGNISVGNGALWMGRDFGRVDLLRVDPVTLQERVFARDLDTTQP